MKSRTRKTATSSFGTKGRVSHDSAKFYKSRLYGSLLPSSNKLSVSNPLPKACVNKIFCKSSESMDDLPDGCVHLMITSPPYNVTKEYDEDFTLEEYRQFLKRVFSGSYRVLADGGRACVNVANIGRKPYIPLHAYIIEDMLEIGFSMRGEIIWNKGTSAGPSTAWGSWQSASNPTLRDVHEYILVFSKGDFSRNGKDKKNTITRDEFLENTKSVWTLASESARRVGHPAPFPVELPRRLIELYSFENDVVLDPFAGSGSTCLAAKTSRRIFVGYEKNDAYVQLALKRLMDSSK